MNKEEHRTDNMRLAKKRVQCLNEALCFVSSSVLKTVWCFEIRFFAKRQTVRSDILTTLTTRNERYLESKKIANNYNSGVIQIVLKY